MSRPLHLLNFSALVTDNQQRLNGFRHVIKVKTLREDLTGVNVAFQDSIQQNLTIMGRH